MQRSHCLSLLHPVKMSGRTRVSRAAKRADCYSFDFLVCVPPSCTYKIPINPFRPHKCVGHVIEEGEKDGGGESYEE
jgi:hypothetical protein